MTFLVLKMPQNVLCTFEGDDALQKWRINMDKFNHEHYQDPTAFEALTALENEEPTTQTYRSLIYIASPFAGDTKRNVEKARGYSRFAISKGCIPLTPHLIYPQILDDDDKDQRALGLRFALILLVKCDELWVFGECITDGMSREITKANRKGMPIRYFTSHCEEVTK